MSKIIIRQLAPEDWKTLREIRLEALRAHPELFMSGYEQEEAKPELYWREKLDNKGKALFGLFEDDRIVGMTAIYTWNRDQSGQTAVLASSYIKPAYRGTGLSRQLYEARIGWAVGQPRIKKIVVSHREGNEISRRANQAFGFEFTGKEMVSWPDGKKEYEHNYCLDINTLRKAKFDG